MTPVNSNPREPKIRQAKNALALHDMFKDKPRTIVEALVSARDTPDNSRYEQGIRPISLTGVK